MTALELQALAGLIRRERELLMARWREQVCQLPSARNLDTPTLNDHIPSMLLELAQNFEEKSNDTIGEAHCEKSPPEHGWQRAKVGFDIAEVVAEYNILRGCVHDLAEEHGLALRTKAFHILNRVLDGAICEAVQTFATERALDIQRRREEYLTFVAHDLRTPLNAISLAARVLEGSPALTTDPESSLMLRSLRRNVRQLESLVSEVLEESNKLKTEVGLKLERRTLDLWPLVEALIHDVRPVAGTASTRLTNEVPEDLVIWADASLLGRILQNLIANAITYTPHGQVVIGACEHPEDDTVQCWVRDDGAGIPEPLLAQIFDKGTGDQERPESLGLGLAIVKTFVEAHGGRVSAERGTERGTTMRFWLPRRRSASQGEPPARGG